MRRYHRNINKVKLINNETLWHNRDGEIDIEPREMYNPWRDLALGLLWIAGLLGFVGCLIGAL